MKETIKNLGIKFFLTSYLKYKYNHKKPSDFVNERTLEYPYILSELSRVKANKILDIGSGRTSFPSTLESCGYDITASDLKGSYYKMFHNHHIHVVKDNITRSRFSNESFDVITCISTLEHIPDFNVAINEMVRLLKPEGFLILTFPYQYDEFQDNVYELVDSNAYGNNSKFITRSYSDSEIHKWIDKHSLKKDKIAYYKGFEGKFWSTGKRINFPYWVDNKEVANGVCITLKKEI